MSRLCRRPSPGRFAGVLAAALAWAAGGGCREVDKQRWDEFWKSSRSGSIFSLSASTKELWTIECSEYRGPMCHETADRLAAALKKVEGIKPSAVWVEHDAERARVFYGEYKLRYEEAKTDDPSHARGDMIIKLSDEIKRDLEFIRILAVGDQYPFFSARVLEKPSPDVGPPEWDLRNAKGVYTLNVGVTYNTPTLHNYKEAAIEWVKDLRSRGFEAYYYHDPEKPQTSICLGTFADDAVRESPDGDKKYSEGVRKLRDNQEFRYNLENGHKVSRAARNAEGRLVKVPNPSFLVKIPEKDGKKPAPGGPSKVPDYP